MEGASIAMLAGLGVFALWVLVKTQKTSSPPRDATLSALARLLDGIDDGSSAKGVRGHVAITYRFETRGSGSTSESWTEIDAQLPSAYPLSIYLRRHQGSDRGHIRDGEMVDVEVGDPAFDAAFLVEAAPAEIVRMLLDAHARALLAAHDPVELTTIREGERAIMRFAIRTWERRVEIADAMLTSVARIAGRVRDVFAEADEHAPRADIGSPYRPAFDEQPARDLAAARVAEVAALEATRAALHARQLTIGIVLFIAFVVAICAAMIAVS